MDIYLNTLIAEVTELCNMAPLCEHCLRGCPRNINLQKETVDKLLDQISGIGSLVFTGGEPTLNLPIIEYIFDEIRRRKMSLGSFWLATNGVANSMELAVLLLKNADLCEEPELMGVAISTDIYHNADTETNPLRYLKFYDSSKEFDASTERPLIAMGYAEDNGLGGRPYTPDDQLYVDPFNNGKSATVDQVYLRANGDILADCDLSYDTMDELAICKVEDFTDVVEYLAKKELAA